jgi:hypothetical protein
VGGSLDNVSLLAIGPAAAATALPEPATAGLVLAALGCMWFARRRRSA